MSYKGDVHVYEVECADPKCRKRFHLMTDDNHEPAEGLMCVACQEIYHKTGVLHAKIKRGNGKMINLHTGYLPHAIDRVHRFVIMAGES